MGLAAIFNKFESGLVFVGTLVFKAPSSGTYSLEVRSYQSTYLGGYQLVVVDVGLDVGAMDDLGHSRQGGVVQPVLEEDRLKRAPAIHVAELNAVDIEGHPVLLTGDFRHLLRLHKEKLRIAVDESPDEPGTSDAVHGRVLAGHENHQLLPGLSPRECSFRCSATSQVQSSTTCPPGSVT